MSNEIKCPHCGEAFTVDESGYAAILNQVRDQEFQREVDARVSLAEKSREQEVALAVVEGRRGPARANRRARRRARQPESPAVYQGERGGGGAQAGRERCDGRRGRAAARGGARARRAGPEAGESARASLYGTPRSRCRGPRLWPRTPRWPSSASATICAAKWSGHATNWRRRRPAPRPSSPGPRPRPRLSWPRSCGPKTSSLPTASARSSASRT